ncbi:MAG: hypothetical protein ACEQSR_01495 [Candidatus Methylacidiphilales bacterium]
MENLKNLTPTEIRRKIENKKKAVADLSRSLSRQTENGYEFREITNDIKELNTEISKLQLKLAEIETQKDFKRSLNESFEL